MSKQDKLDRMRRIYVIGRSPARCRDWMEGRELFRPGDWVDPRVTILHTLEQISGIALYEQLDVHYEFLPDWQAGHSPEFVQYLWKMVPHIMQREKMRRVVV